MHTEGFQLLIDLLDARSTAAARELLGLEITSQDKMIQAARIQERIRTVVGIAAELQGLESMLHSLTEGKDDGRE